MTDTPPDLTDEELEQIQACHEGIDSPMAELEMRLIAEVRRRRAHVCECDEASRRAIWREGYDKGRKSHA